MCFIYMVQKIAQYCIQHFQVCFINLNSAPLQQEHFWQAELFVLFEDGSLHIWQTEYVMASTKIEAL